MNTKYLHALAADVGLPLRYANGALVTAQGFILCASTTTGSGPRIVALVNALPELLEAAEDLELWNDSPFARLVDLLADPKTENLAATDFQHARSDGTQERWILSAQRAEGKTLVDRCAELTAALATAEAERLTLARAFDAATRDLDCGDNSCRFKAHGPGGMRTNGGCSCLGVKDGGGMRGIEVSRAVEVSRHIVKEVDRG